MRGMRDDTKEWIALLLAFVAGAALALLVLVQPADAATTQVEDWTNDMNQESYWEQRFGAECTKYENHNGFVPVEYDIAVTKGGQFVAIYDPAPDNDFVQGPNGKDISWIMKCKLIEQPTTTTTLPEEETTTTTLPPTTTTIVEDTSTTTTTPPVSSTTTPGFSSTTTEPPPPSMSTPEECPMEDRSSQGYCPDDPTPPDHPNIEPPDDVPTEVEVPELPYTGVSSGVLLVVATSLLVGGVATLKRARVEHE